jgi:CRP-like cAMP-binding protein
LGQGEIFGEISLFYDIPRTATASAAENNTVIGVLGRPQFRALIKNFNESTKALIYRLYLFLPDRLRSLNEKYKIVISNLVHLIGRENLEEELLSTIESHFKKREYISKADFSTAESISLFNEERKFSGGENIFHEGDEADGAYLVKDGRVGIFGHVNGMEVLLAEMRQNDFFGEMALIDGKPRSADARALSDATLGFLPVKGYDAIINERSELSYKLMSSLCLGLVTHIRRLDKLYLEVKGFISKKQEEG